MLVHSKNIIISFITFFFLNSFCAYAIDYNQVDSLQKVILDNDDATLKVKAFIKLSNICSEDLPADGINYALRGLSLLENKSEPELVTESYYLITKCYLKLHSIKEASNYNEKAIESSNKINNNKLQGLVNLQKGRILSYSGNSDEALKYLELGLANFKLINDYKNIALSYTYLGNLYLFSDYELSIEYYEKAITIYTELEEYDSSINCLIQRSKAFRMQGEIEKSYNSIIDAFLLKEYNTSETNLKRLYFQYSQVHEDLGNKDSSIYYLKRMSYVLDSLAYAKHNDDLKMIDFRKTTVENLGLEVILSRNSNKKNLVIFMISTISILLFIFAFIYYKKSDESSKLSKKLVDQNSRLEESLNEVENLVNELNETNNKIEYQNRELNEKNLELVHIHKLLKKSNDDKDKFFSIIAHDLVNSVFGFILETDYLAKAYPNIDQVLTKNKLEILSKYSKRLYNVLNNLLQWARTQTDRIEFEPETIQLNGLIKSNFDFYELPAKMKNVSLINNVDESRSIYADKNLINTCIRNLVNNAVKFTSDGGSVTIDFESLEKYDKISIIDTGIGMSQEKIDEIFSDSDLITSTKGTGKEIGTGLGTLLCKEFIAMHNGKIEVESVQGEGTTFHLIIPKGEFGSDPIS